MIFGGGVVGVDDGVGFGGGGGVGVDVDGEGAGFGGLPGVCEVLGCGFAAVAGVPPNIEPVTSTAPTTRAATTPRVRCDAFMVCSPHEWLAGENHAITNPQPTSPTISGIDRAPQEVDLAQRYPRREERTITRALRARVIVDYGV